ncbi:MAG: SDR family oxidoreductase [Cytophagales bacterium]|nr:SDR family oxidoreductase [Cytophagales bacterium]
MDFSKLSILITGGAGFIGSHLVDYFIQSGSKEVRILDNFSSGSERNIQDHLSNPRLRIIKGDIRDLATCQEACYGMDVVLHQAAFNSVPRSIHDPITTTQVNIVGMVNMLKAASDNQVKRFVYASSSSVYGTNTELPKVESRIGTPLSPYALSKAAGEQYAQIYSAIFSLPTIGLRYFNVFGPRQNPDGDYAAFIPRLIRSFISHTPLEIFGDGEQSRDFTFVSNVVQANVLAAFTSDPQAINKVYNIALGHTVSLNQLIGLTRKITQTEGNITYSNPRIGDIRDSMADISLAKKILGFQPDDDFEKSYTSTFEWFKNNLKQ